MVTVILLCLLLGFLGFSTYNDYDHPMAKKAGVVVCATALVLITLAVVAKVGKYVWELLGM